MKLNSIAFTALLALAACSDSNDPTPPPPPPANRAPVISAMTLSSPTIERGMSADLTVTATDADGDALTYTFSEGTCPGTVSAVDGTPNVATFDADDADATFGPCDLEVAVADTAGHTVESTVTLEIDATRVFVVTPTDPVAMKNVVGIGDDGAPELQGGSIKSRGVAKPTDPASVDKAEIYLVPSDLFGRPVTLGDVARMSYWTKKDQDHVVQATDWYLNIYTAPYPAQASGWYGARIGAEPYYAINLAETVGAWNLWSTDGAENQLRFFESTYGNFGAYTDPAWSEFVAGSSLTGERSATAVPYATQEVKYFTVQTASSAVGLESQLDGVTIELVDGAIAVIDMQPDYPLPVSVPVFDNLPAVLPPNVPSQPFQAQQTAEFGDFVTLATGTARHADKATVVMVTWSTEAYSHPITLNLYDGTPGNLTLIGSRTQTFAIPARPPADPTCPDTGYGAGVAWRASNGNCYNGSAFTITFDLSLLGVVLPDSFAYGIAYNTNTWGYSPIGQSGPYESLNVGVIGDGTTVASTTPSVGTDPDPDAALRNYWNFSATPQAAYTGYVTESGWTGYSPAVKFFAY